MSEQTPPHDTDADDRTTGDGPQDPETASVFFGPSSPDFPPAGRRPAPGTIGQYHLKRELAGGAMGTVYEAVQHSPHRVVALKLMRRGVASPAALRRFESESQFLARLRHPGIAQVYEAGTHNDISGSLPYFAMEYIPNAKPITQYAHDRNLSVPERLELFIQVCEAVQHGHGKAIIHRDLKPSNILVDGNGQVKVIDFGVARSTDSDMNATAAQTAVGEFVGTLRYMSPEQCAGDPHDIDVRSDVYALGVVLYELLGGRLPYDFENAPLVDTPRVIREAEPIRLSRLNRSLHVDLETIVLKALAKDRARRYGSVAALGDDLRRYLNDQPIRARPPRALYRAQKFVRRRRIPVTVAAVLLFAVVALAERQVRLKRLERETIRAQLAATQAQLAVADASRLAEAIGALGSNTGLMSSSQIDDARRLVKQCTVAIELKPELPMPYAVRARVFARTGRPQDAWTDCRRALELAPDNSLALRTAGYILLTRGDFEKALQYYNRGIEGLQQRNEYMADDFHNRAILHRKAGAYFLALTDCDRAVALAPGPLTYLNRGATRRMAGDIDGAIEDFSRTDFVGTDWLLQCQQWIWEMRRLRGGPGDDKGAEEALSAAELAAKTELDRGMVGVSRGLVGEQMILSLIEKQPARRDRLQACAFYYLGVRALAEGREGAASRYLEQCTDRGGDDQLETDFARWHLKRIASQ